MTDNTEPSVSRMRKNRPRPPTIIRGIISGEGFVSRWKSQTRFSKAEKKKKKKKKKESIREKIFKLFSNFLETARYSACLRDRCSTLLFSSPFTDLDTG